MPIYSEDRRCFLYTVDECAALAGKTRRTIQRYLTKEAVYREYRQVSFGRGSTQTLFLDPLTLPVSAGVANVAVPVGTATRHNDTSLATRKPNDTTEVEPGAANSRSSRVGVPDAEPVAEDRDKGVNEVWARIEKLRPLMDGSSTRRKQEIEELAREEGVSVRTVYRWLRSLEKRGVRGLLKPPRTNAGCPNVPTDAYHLVVAALVTNPPTTSCSQIHRTLLRAVPTSMSYERGSSVRHVSLRTVQRIRKNLESDPRTRLLFFDEDKRKEYLRTYAGEVVSAHANDLWQMDMTRCDTLVIDPDTGSTFRPRVHAIIDVYSGCIPGIVFSIREDQPQTDLAILRAVLPKSGPYAHKYPVHGVPRRLYLDNGKTYTSEQAHRVLSGLGVEVIHSLPRVSHTRGRIERFFGTLHSFERALPGYVGRDASDRATREIKRLTRNTKAWLEHGRDPGHSDRLLTIDEYQNFVLAWLVAEYHPWPVDGQTRLEHFVETVPPKSQAVLDKLELLLLFAERTTRVVEPGGTIRLENQRWTVPDGSLVRFQGKKVVVLRDQFTLGDGHRLLAWKDRHGRIEVIGQAIPAPTVADSLEAGELRRASKAQAQQALRDAKEQAKELTDPELRVSVQLAKEAEVVFEEAPVPSARARIAAVRPTDPREVLDSSDPLVQHFLDPLSSLGDAPEDPVARLRWIRERRKRDDA